MSVYRITFVDSIRSWGGAEVWVLDTVTELRRRGLAADILPLAMLALCVLFIPVHRYGVISIYGFLEQRLGLGSRLGAQAAVLGLAGHARPNRVRPPTDWSFTSCCFPRRLMATAVTVGYRV